MANKFYGLNRGESENPESVTVGASTGATDVELRINTGQSLNRDDIYRITNTLLRRVLDGRDANLPGV